MSKVAVDQTGLETVVTVNKGLVMFGMRPFEPEEALKLAAQIKEAAEMFEPGPVAVEERGAA